MREILFRGKRVDNGKWAVGNLMASDDALEGYEAIIIPRVNSDIYTSEAKSDLGICKWYIVDQKTVCQYTGLTDKNGKKIFEGDIITYFEEIENVCYNSLSYRETTGLFEPNRERHNEKFTGTVSFDKDFCGYIVSPVSATCHITYARKSLRDFSVKNIEVIGNIFDNPELLTED